MPTGYTAALYDGEQSFKDYALGVARGFGALVTMRDAPGDAEIPEVFEPASYYVDRVETARAALDAASNASDERLAERQWHEIQKAREHLTNYVDEREARRARYEAMLAKARTYVPPTPDHSDFAKTLVEQLERSLDFDCGGSYEPPIPEPMSLGDYRQWLVAKAQADLQDAEEALREEEERAENRTAWVRALRDSLAGVSA